MDDRGFPDLSPRQGYIHGKLCYSRVIDLFAARSPAFSPDQSHYSRSSIHHEPHLQRESLDYSDYWDELDADPHVNVMEDARESPNPKYLCDLEAIIPERGCRNFGRDSTYSIAPRKRMPEHTSAPVLDNVPDEPYADIEMGVL
ncbi:hypothetical protein CNMCM5623_000626 [Aspergillus felis]|uniref:Uncharacterized protein n=1 Tax=Aspergillus felis TaxID=1287682 RepID=A0A8H6UWY9_9EURO|nr:hypothetical protein CNMCM5623_000626 [Aspergillus felis]